MKPIPELHPGDNIRYKKYGHVFNGTIRAINNEYYFRSGDVGKAYLTTHPGGWDNIPVRPREVLGLDITEQK